MQDDDGRKRPAYPIESVENALKLLLLFKERKRIGIAEAAVEIGVARSTAHRLFAMLQYYGFARQEGPSRAYVPGHALHEIGLAAIASMDLRTVARPAMERLARAVGETVYLAVRDVTRMLFLESIESANQLRLTTRTGMSYPAHTSAIGRVQLAALSDDELLALYPSERLEPGPLLRLPERIQTRSELFADLAEVRRLGYSVNLGEPEQDVTAVAAAIRDRTGRVRASIAVGGPTSRLGAREVPGVAQAVVRTASEIGARLEG